MHPSVTFIIKLLVSMTGAVHHILFCKTVTYGNILKLCKEFFINFFNAEKRMESFLRAKMTLEANMVKVNQDEMSGRTMSTEKKQIFIQTLGNLGNV